MHAQWSVRHQSVSVFKSKAVTFLINRAMSLDFFDPYDQIHFAPPFFYEQRISWLVYLPVHQYWISLPPAHEDVRQPQHFTVRSKSSFAHPRQLVKVDIAAGENHADPFAGLVPLALQDRGQRHGR